MSCISSDYLTTGLLDDYYDLVANHFVLHLSLYLLLLDSNSNKQMYSNIEFLI